MDFAREGKYDEFWEEIDKTWQLFDFPCYEESLFYLLIEDIIKVCTESKQFEKGNKYMALLFISGAKRVDDGSRELVAAKMAYAQGDLEIAKELAYLANKKSEGRRLRNCKELKDLIKGAGKRAPKKKEKKRPVVCAENYEELYEIIKELSEKGDKAMERKDFLKAEEHWEEALTLVPEPKNQYAAATWLYAALGDLYFLQNRFDEAKVDFELAYSAMDGVTNPFVQYMLGKTYYKLGNMEKAKELLAIAYMNAGEEIFEDDDKVYLKMATE